MEITKSDVFHLSASAGSDASYFPTFDFSSSHPAFVQFYVTARGQFDYMPVGWWLLPPEDQIVHFDGGLSIFELRFLSGSYSFDNFIGAFFQPDVTYQLNIEPRMFGLGETNVHFEFDVSVGYQPQLPSISVSALEPSEPVRPGLPAEVAFKITRSGDLNTESHVHWSVSNNNSYGTALKFLPLSEPPDVVFKAGDSVKIVTAKLQIPVAVPDGVHVDIDITSSDSTVSTSHASTNITGPTFDAILAQLNNAVGVAGSSFVALVETAVENRLLTDFEEAANAAIVAVKKILAPVAIGIGLTFDFSIAEKNAKNAFDLAEALPYEQQAQAMYAAARGYFVDVANSLEKALFVSFAGAVPAAAAEVFIAAAGGAVAVGAAPLIVIGIATAVAVGGAIYAYDQWLADGEKKHLGEIYDSHYGEPGIIKGELGGHVVKGYISDATVFADANGNNILDPGEAWTTTDAHGNFVLAGGSGHLVTYGGTDTTTGLPFNGVLSAAAGSSVITPLTTLADQPGSGLDEVLHAFGLPQGLDITSYDPFVATAVGDQLGPVALVAAAKVYDAISIVSAALAPLGVSPSTGNAAVFAALAQSASATSPDQTVDLTSAAVLAEIVEHVGTALGRDLSSLQDVLVQLIASSNAALDDELAAGLSNSDLYHHVVATERVAQDLSLALHSIAPGDSSDLQALLAQFTGPALAAKIEQAIPELPQYAPDVLHQIADQSVSAATEWTYQIPSDAFIDYNADPLVYSAALADGSPLPDWLSFDPASRTFTGLPPSGFVGNIGLDVHVADGLLTADCSFTLNVKFVTNDHVFVSPGVTVVLDPSSLLENDVDANHLAITSVQNADGVSVELNNDGTITLLAGGVSGGTFEYAVTDGTLSDTAVVNVTAIATTDGADTIVIPTGVSDTSYVDGGGGDDALTGLGGKDTLIGGGGADILSGFDNDDHLDGGDQDDKLNGGDGNDVLVGGAGDDTLNGGPGDDALNGGLGHDTASYEGATGGVNVSVSLFGPQDTGGGGRDTLSSIENLSGSIFGDTLTGNAGSNVLNGLGGDDTLAGGNGSDTLNGGAGPDTMVGGLGNDKYFVDDALDQIVEQPGQGIDTVYTGMDFVLPENFDNLQAISNSSLKLTGNDLDNQIHGAGGQDNINGEAGNDVLWGGGGNDSLTGGAGLDRMFGNEGNDTFGVGAEEVAAGEVYSGGAGIDTLSGNVDSELDLSDITIAGIENLSGFSYGVILTAQQLNQFSGYISSGPITLVGAGNANIADATVYTQTINLFADGDRLTFNVDSAFHVVNGGDGGDVITAVGNHYSSTINSGGGVDRVEGSSSGDTINGGAGDDILFGRGGGDYLTGGAGLDHVYGNDDDDTFYLDTGELVPGEVYDGGNGNDTVVGNFSEQVDLSAVSVVRMENLSGFGNGIELTAKQLDQFDGYISTGAITLTGAGYVNIADATLYTQTINLSADGNRLALNTRDMSHTLNGGAGNDIVLVVDGGYGATLNGGGGDDRLIGSSGADTINGGAGQDTLSGGMGDDVFVFNAGEASGDRLTDFKGVNAGGRDQLQFVGYGPNPGFTQIDGTHWQVSDATHHEVIAFSNAAHIGADDFHFV